MSPPKNPYPKPLPANLFPPGTESHDAYRECLRLEQMSESAWDTSLHDLGPGMVARVLGYALCLSPNDVGRGALAKEINSCKGSGELLARLANLYVYGLIRTFYNPRGSTPGGSPGSFLEPIEFDGEIRVDSMPDVTSAIQNLLDIRDQHRCVFTDRTDSDFAFSQMHNGVKFGECSCSITGIAHIINQSISSDGESDTLGTNTKFPCTSSVIGRFGGFCAEDVLGEDNLSSPLNAFTLEASSYHYFSSLDLWLVPSKDINGHVVPNMYNVCHSESLHSYAVQGMRIKSQVAFNHSAIGRDGSMIPPPDPRLLALHATCAQVAHLSGAIGHLRKPYEDATVVTEGGEFSKL